MAALFCSLNRIEVLTKISLEIVNFLLKHRDRVVNTLKSIGNYRYDVAQFIVRQHRSAKDVAWLYCPNDNVFTADFFNEINAAAL